MERSKLSDQHARGELRMCNCADCGKTLLSVYHRLQVEAARRRGEDISWLPPLVAGRINGRPYCSACLASDAPPPAHAGLTPRQLTKTGKTDS